TFATVFGDTITKVRIFSDKPILLSETAVGPAAGQFAKINNLFDGMRRYKTLGLVWFDIAQSDGILHQNWRIEDSQAAMAAFRFGVSPLTLARPSPCPAGLTADALSPGPGSGRAHMPDQPRWAAVRAGAPPRRRCRRRAGGGRIRPRRRRSPPCAASRPPRAPPPRPPPPRRPWPGPGPARRRPARPRPAGRRPPIPPVRPASRGGSP